MKAALRLLTVQLLHFCASWTSSFISQNTEQQSRFVSGIAVSKLWKVLE